MGCVCIPKSNNNMNNNKNNIRKINNKNNNKMGTGTISKLERCKITKTYNFDNQNLDNLDFLDHECSNNTKNDTKLHVNLLSASQNQITTLPHTFLSSIENVKKIILNNNAIQKTNSLFLPNLNTLKSINLSYNKIELLQGDFINLTSLIELNLAHNKIKNLPNDINKLNKLEVLDISHNNINVFPCSIIIPFVSLDKVYINNNRINSFESSLNFSNINSNKDNSWKENNLLKFVDLSFNNLNAKDISTDFIKNSKIGVINLKSNNITIEELKNIDGFSDLIKRRKEIKDKGFSNNLDVGFDLCGLD